MEASVIHFVAEFVGVPASRVTPATLLGEDLGVDGDDGRKLLAEFAATFDVNMACVEEAYFGPEGFLWHFFFTWPAAFFAGLLDLQEAGRITPLPVSRLIASAEAGYWVQ